MDQNNNIKLEVIFWLTLASTLITVMLKFLSGTYVSG